MPRDALLVPLFALSEEKAAALLAHRPWPGEEHAAIRTSESYLAFAEVAVAGSPKLGRLMAGGTLNVAHELGGYSATQPDGAWVISAARGRDETRGRSGRDEPRGRAPGST